MRKSKKQLIRAIIACGLVVSVAAGGTVAYLTDAETATNTFTVGKVKIDLEEPGYPGNDSDEVKNIIPNQEIVKDPQIENTGNNDALVFLRVEVPQETFTDEDDNTGEQKKQDLFKLKGISDQWELLRTETPAGADGKTKTSYVYGYKKVLTKNSTTDKLFQKVQMKNAVESDLSGSVEDIVVTACAIQATDIPDMNLTPAEDGTLGKDVLDQVYAIFLNQSGNQTSRPADEGDRNQNGKLGKISYELDGGTLADGSLTEYGSADYGYTPPTPTKEGYTFTGWSPANIPTKSTGNITFTAKWESTGAMLNYGGDIAWKMKNAAGDSVSSFEQANTSITAIQKSSEAPDSSIMNDWNHVIGGQGNNQVYIWFENGVIKWWTQAEKVNASAQTLYYLCYNLQNLTDISGLADWNVENATTMECTFARCNNLTDLSPIAHWNVKNVQRMTQTFAYCSTLADLTPLKNWDVSNVQYLDYTFGSCDNINDVSPLNSWNTSNVKSMSQTFRRCPSLSNLGLTNWDTGNVTTMISTFANCSALEDISDLKNWNTENVTNIASMFFDCTSLTNANPLNAWDTSNVTDMSSTFLNCSSLTSAILPDWNTAKVTSMGSMFSGCEKLSSLNLSSWNTQNVTNMSYMFDKCANLTDISSLANWDTSSATTMARMFNKCTSLKNASSINDWDISNVTKFDFMFNSCPSHPEFTRRTGTWNSDGTFRSTT